MRKTLVILAAAAVLAAGQAAAHARLISGAPKNGSTVVAPKELVLHYSESIVTSASGVSVKKAAGTPVATAPITLDKDKRTVHAAFTAPPAHGAYKVHWRMKTEDGHETEGEFGFTVK